MKLTTLVSGNFVIQRYTMKSILKLLLLFISSGNLICFGQQTRIRLEHISIEQGLSQSEVNCIYQDKEGFLWFGTLDGLNRFDGYDMAIYRKNTDIPNGISNNYIQSIYEDRSGNLWIGTLGGGINKYDRNRDAFTSYRHQNNNPKSIVNDYVSYITQLKNGKLLFATQRGLIVIEPDNLNKAVPEFKNYLNFEINAILEDKDGIIWLATWDGLYKVKFNKQKVPEVITHYIFNPANHSGIASNGVFSLYQDKEGSLWIGTNNGLDRLAPRMLNSTGKVEFEHFQNTENCENCLPNNQVMAIHEDRTGKLLIGTRGGGLSYFDKKNTFFTYKAEKYDPASLSNNSVKCLFEDRTGVLWIGTLGGGVNKLDLLRKQFNSYEIVLNNSKHTPSNFIRAIYEDENKLLWIGTLDGGLFSFNRKTNSYSQFKQINNEIEYDKAARNSSTSIYGKNVFSIIKGDNGQIWVGTNGGINIINQKTGKLTHHAMDYQNPDSLISNSVFSIEKDDDGTFWIGTWGALHHYLPAEKGAKGRFVRYTNNINDTNSISDNIVRHVYNDPQSSDLWISTMNGGLNRVMKDKDNQLVKFVQYRQNSNNPAGISSNEVNMVLRSKAGDLWIATNDGLNKLIPGKDPYHGTFVKFKEKDGLSGNHVQSILEDAKGNLWIGTNKGLSRFNPATSEFSNFDVSDGLQSNEFSEHTCFLSHSGEMFFGGVNGFNSFFPDSIKKNNHRPIAKITNLLIFNKTVPIGKPDDDRSTLTKSITQTSEITLSYKDNVFTIEFSALHFASPEKNKYAYKMEGFNENWLYTDSKNRKATFTNLKGGSYTFKVKASNNDGLWQEEPTVLKIRITPPIWKTWQFFILYILILIAIIYTIFKEIKTKEKLKSEIAYKNLEKEKAEELNQMKLQFFTNISHEFRTPLTLIISPIENLLNTIKANSFLKEQLTVMHRNSQYLLRLINELMDFRKAETGSWKLNAGKHNLVAFVREIATTFNDIADKRHISFQFTADIEEIGVWFDREMLIKILNNLIYNAFKFTPDGGQIKVVIQKNMKESDPATFQYKYEIKDDVSNLKNYVAIKVIDNGIGISGQSIGNIFNRYYQVGSSDSVKHIGSGIGLALTKNLVLLSKGEIIVSSERDKGSEFIVKLPLGESHLSELEKITDEDAGESHDTIKLVNPSDEFGKNNESGDYPVEDTVMPLILVVEDNDEMRHFIKQNLGKKFRVIEAVNGLEGFKMATERIPDLIVSDVIMPELGGIQLCKKLKKDVLTSHIPVVLLTALAAVSNQIEGLETGADDYISKPFNYKLFEIRIENLIRSRKKLRERFGKEIEIESKDFTLNRRDQEFLDKAIKLVKEKIAEPELSVDNLSKDLGMSRIHLHRKITALTDQTPSEFIRTIRLKEAARLLAENRLSISEIAYRVGFTAPSYFTTCFGKQFGISPKEYLGRK